MNRLRAACAVFLLAVQLGGCASEPVYRIAAPPSVPPPWRAVLLPVAPASPADGAEAPAFGRDLLHEVRSCLALEIPQDAYRLIALPRVDRTIPLADGPVADEAAIARAGRALGADLVLLPELFAWDRKYYLLHSVARVGLRVKVHDGRTGELLAESSHERVRNQGILKIPLGYGGAVYGPIRGLLHGQMSLLCDDVAVLIGEDLAAFARGDPGEGGGESSRARNAPD